MKLMRRMTKWMGRMNDWFKERPAANGLFIGSFDTLWIYWTLTYGTGMSVTRKLESAASTGVFLGLLAFYFTRSQLNRHRKQN